VSGLSKNFVALAALLLLKASAGAQSPPRQPATVSAPTLESFESGDPAARVRVLHAIGARRLSPDLAALRRILTTGLLDSDPSVRASAMSAVAARAAAPRLTGARGTAAEWMAERRILLETRPRLVSLLQEPDPSARHAAVLALGNIALSQERRQDGRLILGKDTVDVFFQVFNSDSDARVRTEIAKSFALLGDDTPEVRVVIERSLDEEASALRQYGAVGAGRLRLAAALPSLIERLSDTEPGTRLSAVAALRRFGSAAESYKGAIASAREREQVSRIRDDLAALLVALGK
jgi:HEAT repeat protein